MSRMNTCAHVLAGREHTRIASGKKFITVTVRGHAVENMKL